MTLDALREWLESAPVLWVGVLASFAASLGTSAGALPVYLFRRVPTRTENVLMSASAGVMLAAAVYSLVLPALEAAGGTGSVGAALRVGASIIAGAAVILLIHHRVPHEHFIKPHDTFAPDPARWRKVWLFVIAITLHNFPEGMAVGVGFGGGQVDNGLALTAAIFVQNLPEGFIVALALVTLGYSRTRAFAIAGGTGIVESVGGLFGATVVSLAHAMLPWALGFAAGAMLFVISHEIIPETHRKGHEAHATIGLLVGFALMLVLDAALATG